MEICLRNFNLLLLSSLLTGVLSASSIIGNKTEYFHYILLEDGSVESDPCNRKCVLGQQPMVCKYHFTLEWYDILSKACFDCPKNVDDCFRLDCIPADGIKRPVLVVNRKLPGPAINICQGDQVIVDVENRLLSDSTSIHWHGQKQKDYPYMDGVPFVTQCPILPQTTFRYQFIAEDSGTHFWHSHTGVQRGDGVFGAMIVRVPEENDPHSSLYDYDLKEHTITIMDWDHVTGNEKFVTHHHSNGDNKPTNLLINGLGRYNGKNEDSTIMPTARFNVKQSFRYRFRIINAGFLNCPIEVSIDNHTLLVISSDGYDFKPVEVSSIVTYAGERFDFIVHANQPEDVYWMRFGGLMDCDERFTSAHQVAVLHYENEGMSNRTYPRDVPHYNKTHPEGPQINPLNKGTESDEVFVSAPEIESLQEWDESLKETPDFTYFVAYDFYRKDNPHFHKAPYYGFSNITKPNFLVLTPQLNHISLKYLSFPLLPQRDEIREGMLCNETTMRGKNCKNEFCECMHVINVDLNAVVELIIIDKGFAYDANHPFHLHGHSFRVVGMQKVGHNVTVEQVYKLHKEKKIERNLINPPWKDTVTVPDGGFTVLRFQANNPGYWIFHCHIEFHVEVGMALIFKVGQHKDMLPVPRNFPKCGNYFNDEVEEITQPPLCKNVKMLSRLENSVPFLFGTKCIESSDGTLSWNLGISTIMSISSLLYFLCS